MKYISIILILFFSISSCEVKNENLVIENSEEEIDVVKTLQDSVLTNTTKSNKVSANIIRKFNALEIPIKVCASFQKNGRGNIDSLVFNYNNKSFLHLVKNYTYVTTDELIYLKNSNDYNIKFKDYNFDNHPDLVVYNSNSGMKNIVEDIYIYSPKSQKFIFNKILSENANCKIDTKSKSISTFSQGGMASKIYGITEYKWNNEKLEIVKKVNQDYLKSLNAFICTTKTRIDTSWITEIDTLYEVDFE